MEELKECKDKIETGVKVMKTKMTDT